MLSAHALLAIAHLSALSTPLPVRIANEVRFADSAWAIGATIASAVVALATFFLAFYTWQLARETRDSLAVARTALESERLARKDEQERHQDGFMPHLALLITDQKVDHKLIGGGLTRQSFGREMYIRNVGVGPALNVKVVFGGKKTRNVWHDPHLPKAFAVGDNFMLLRGESDSVDIDVTLDYEDVFGRKYSSVVDGRFEPATTYTWNRTVVAQAYSEREATE